jgi:transposase-like protein
MKSGCPNIHCKFFNSYEQIIKNGRFKRKSDSRYVQKYKCKHCAKQFSRATFTLEKYQKKRRINLRVLESISSGVSMRRLAKQLRVDKKTIKRKVDYLALKSKQKNDQFLNKLSKEQVTHMQFDDLITTEHTKLKPLSVSIAVDADRRYILAAQVSQIPAFGHLAELSRKKYGYRKSGHKTGLKTLFEKIHKTIHPTALIRSDEHNNYPEFVAHYLPETNYQRYKGGRGCVVGQGELKKLKSDPLFAINHTCAMFRANINRLIRKTWCTTKDPTMLKKHIEIFIYYFNHIYLRDVRT